MSYLKEIILNSFQGLIFGKTGLSIDSVKMLRADASERKIYRINAGGHTYIGIYNENPKENLAFIKFSETFLELGFNVPEILGFSDDKLFYIEEDLGDLTLKAAVSVTDPVNKLTLYKKALSDLIKFQIIPGNKIDYSFCYQTELFDESVLRDDFNKFRNYFLKKFYTGFNGDNLIERITVFCSDIIRNSSNDFFLYRDFQPRNIMIKDQKFYYIDYQSGRKGPLLYDLVSFLYSGSADLNIEERKLLESYYEENLKNFINYDDHKFRKDFYNFAFIRLLQVLGSYSYIYEKRTDEKMIEKIKQGLLKLKELRDFLENKDMKNFISDITAQGSEFIRI